MKRFKFKMLSWLISNYFADARLTVFLYGVDYLLMLRNSSYWLIICWCWCFCSGFLNRLLSCWTGGASRWATKRRTSRNHSSGESNTIPQIALASASLPKKIIWIIWQSQVRTADQLPTDQIVCQQLSIVLERWLDCVSLHVLPLTGTATRCPTISSTTTSP